MLLPINAKANQNEITHRENYDILGAIAKGQTLYRPNEDIVEKLTQEYESAQKAQAESHAQGLAYNCVAFAKSYTGYAPSAWGNGGRSLPLTSIPAEGSIVVFTYIHVAVITAIAGNYFDVIEANYDHGRITRRTLSFSDPTIKGFYHP